MGRDGFLDREWAKQRLRAIGATQDDVAAHVARDRSMVSRILSGQRRVTITQVKSLAAALQVSPLELLGRCGFADAAHASAKAQAANDDIPAYDGDVLRDVIAQTAKFLADRDLHPKRDELGDLVTLLYEIVASGEAVHPSEQQPAMTDALMASVFRRISRVG